jgi:hypothetical protein
MSNEVIATERQSLVTVAGIVDYFSHMSGGEVTSTTTDVWDGGKTTAEKLAGPPTTANITVSRPFRPGRDQAILKALRPLVGRWRATVSKQWTDADLIAIGDPDVYPNALLIRVAPSAADASSASTGMMELEFAPEASV